MKIVSSMQLKNGATTELNKLGTLVQPVQFLEIDQKDEAWRASNLDWHEMMGLKQLRRNAQRLLKNYKLANGIIDKSDYVVDEDNEMSELVDILSERDNSAFELRFFPIIPNVINVLTGEFAKRNDKITYRAVDDITFNETVNKKRDMIEQVLLQYAEQKQAQNIQSMNIDFNTDEGKQQVQQMMSPDVLKQLPEIEQFFKKSYRSLIEQWASHQHNVDEERFVIKELETMAFKDMLINDREFWHFKMNEDDYEVELWNPPLTFYHKSPHARYISQSNWVGQIELMTIADVIDKLGYLMNDEQLRSLEAIYPIKSAGYLLPGVQNDGSFYDSTKSHEWNVEGPSLGMRQFLAYRDFNISTSDDIIYRILNESEDLSDYGNMSLLRVTTLYWKSQRKVGHLSKIDDNGVRYDLIVDEHYKITIKPEYDTSVIKEKSRENLIYGEHIDWIWINQVWGGKKIGPNRPTFYGNNDVFGFAPMYLDIKPLKFQFKGDFTLYGCKLPVEGAVFSDRNVKSSSLVDKMKPYQIAFNLVNNQIQDILIDELGTVILLDQNSLPQNSMGEDWGKNNFAKAYVAMKNFQMLPLDTSLANTETPLGFAHYQQLNLEQTNRLLSRINLANYFKQQAFDTMGISPQRMGAVNGQETATGVEQAINMSYSQTEMYFIQHSEYLMPRVHQMRTDLAQYYNSTKPSVRLQYSTSMDENINFQINGTELLLKDLNVFISTKINQKQLLEKIQQLALNNNTAGASIYDLGGILKADSMAEVTHVMKSIEEKANKIRQEEYQNQQAQQQQLIQAQEKERQDKMNFESEQNELNRQSNIRIAEIRSAGFGAAVDLNYNKQSDYIDAMEYLDKRNDAREKLNLEKEKEINKNDLSNKQIQLKEKELSSREKIANTQLSIAKENKNKYDKNTK